MNTRFASAHDLTDEFRFASEQRQWRAKTPWLKRTAHNDGVASGLSCKRSAPPPADAIWIRSIRVSPKIPSA